MKRIYTIIGRTLFIILLPLVRIVIRRTERVYVSVTCNGEYLLIKNWLARDTWRLPGGGLRRGESYKTAAIREIHEELGVELRVTDVRYLGKSVATTDKLGFGYELFTAEIPSKTAVTTYQLEITELTWMCALPANHTDELDFAIKCMGIK